MTHEQRLAESASRMSKLLAMNAPAAVVDNEAKLLCRLMATVMGTDRVRRWAVPIGTDEARPIVVDAAAVR